MSCPACLTDAQPGDGHPCTDGGARTAPAPLRTVRPALPMPTSWEKWAWVALALAVVYLVVCATRLAFTVSETSTLVSIVGDRTLDSDGTRLVSLQNNESGLSTLQMLTVFAYLGGYVIFFRKIRGLAVETGLDVRPLFKHWAIYAWQACVAVSVLISFAGPRSGDMSSSDLATLQDRIRHFGAVTEALLGVRILTAAVMVVAILTLRSRTLSALRAHAGTG